MSNNEYYHHAAGATSRSPPPPTLPVPPLRTTSPFYGSDYAPSYRTTDPYGPSSRNDTSASQSQPLPSPPPPHSSSSPQGIATATTSPFDTPFDDPLMQPMNVSAAMQQQQQYDQSHRRDSLYSPSVLTTSQYGSLRHQQPPDTGYYGAPMPALPPPPLTPNDRTADAIPLQDRPNKDVEMNDHVYDAPQGPAGVVGGAAYGQPPPDGPKKGLLGYGELGMFRSGNKKRIPWVTYLLTTVQVAVFIGEIIKNGVMTGSPIQTKPTFNYMIGPSYGVLITMGARYVPCMHNLDVIQGSTMRIDWPCPNATTDAAECTLSEVCGFGGVPNPLYDGNVNQQPEPDQWFRFILPIFLHAGIIHIAFNLFLQLTIGREMEVLIGPIRYFIIYMAAGIFGFVFGGKYAGTAIASTGASGSLFGIMALVLLDLLYSWRERRSPVRELFFLVLEIAVSFVLGLLIPFIDNFAHIGGFIVGICVGISLLHSPNSLRRRLGADPSYNTMHGGPEDHDQRPFYKNPVGFFKGRKLLWWTWWLIRAGVLVLVIVAFIVLATNFYKSGETCTWCKYLNCINVNNWCDAANIKIENKGP